jgi:hypothetical protein
LICRNDYRFRFADARRAKQQKTSARTAGLCQAEFAALNRRDNTRQDLGLSIIGGAIIIEEGLSYGIYTATVEEGARPIIIHPDGDLTINYLDTKGLPLTPDHLSAATALVARMIGTSSQEDKQMLRQAQIAKYLNLLYEDSFQDWQKKRHDQLLDITRHAMALQNFRAERMPPGATTLETFADFRDWKAAQPTEAQEYQHQFEEAAVLKFLKDPRTSKEVRNLAFAHFTPDEFPTHRMLQELMMLDPMGGERDQIMEIATLILPWCRDGNYGWRRAQPTSVDVPRQFPRDSHSLTADHTPDITRLVGDLCVSHTPSLPRLMMNCPHEHDIDSEAWHPTVAHLRHRTRMRPRDK